jgi:hypothetical protein
MNKKIWMALAATVLSTTLGGRAHAGLCALPDGWQKWAISGTAPSFPGSQVSYQLGSLNIDTQCVDDSQETCSSGGGENTCTITDGVKEVFKVSIGEQVGSFTGPPTTSWWPAVDAQPSSTAGWQYASTTIEGNFTEVWFQYQSSTKLSVIFRVTANGRAYVSNLLTFVPVIFNIGNIHLGQ